jgi:hypothetical protein
MWAPPAVSPTSAMFWHRVLAGQLPLRSVLCRAVRGGTVLDHGLGIFAGGNIDFCIYEDICRRRAFYVSLRPCASSMLRLWRQVSSGLEARCVAMREP